MIFATRSFQCVNPWVTSGRDDRWMSESEDEEGHEPVEERAEREAWPRAAWSRAVASNA